VAVTITGYQPAQDEIQGEIDWTGVNATTIEGVLELLNPYFPCTGAVVQVDPLRYGRCVAARPDLSRARQ
jgi:hypothetical protein